MKGECFIWPGGNFAILLMKTTIDTIREAFSPGWEKHGTGGHIILGKLMKNADKRV